MPTQIGTDHGIAQKIWRPALNHQAERSWITQLLTGDEEDSIIRIQDEPQRQAGDTIQIRFSPTIDQPGFGEDDDIEGQEASLRFDFDEMKIGYWAFAYSARNQMTMQRVNIDTKKAALQKLPVNWRRYRERSIFHQLCGSTFVNNSTGLAAAAVIDPEYARFTHKNFNMGAMNEVVAVDANHQVFAGDATSFATIGTDDTISLELFDRLVEKSKSARGVDYPIAPTNLGYWLAVISVEGERQLRAATSTGEWADLQHKLLQGGAPWAKSALATGGVLGVYNNVLIVVSDFLPRGVDSGSPNAPVANTRTGLFLGAKAACMAYGKGYTGENNHLDWTEQIRSYKVWGVAADSVWGCKRTIFPNLDGDDETYGLCTFGYYSAQ